MLTKVYWVDGPWRGRLGILPRPRGGDWLRDETTGWREAGVESWCHYWSPKKQATRRTALGVTSRIVERIASARGASRGFRQNCTDKPMDGVTPNPRRRPPA
jgi:hypothetical protein